MPDTLATLPGFIGEVLAEPAFVDAVRLTILLSLVSGGLSVAIGFLSAFLGIVPGVRWLVRAYVELFRNTPLLVQLYFYYWGLPALGVKLEPFLCGVIGLSLYTGAYMAEVFRSGLLAVRQEQREAGLALGLNPFQVYGWVVVPQAVRVMFPAVCNLLISLTKNSSLVAFIGVSDVFFMVYKGAVDLFEPFRYFLVGALVYLSLTMVVATTMQWLDAMLKAKILRFPALISQAERQRWAA